ncbi:hypothetical protein BT96DRAFT_1009674 [Gymnopus androsaceus JB14]|uniref:Uncharacterized protein n=1 Tax=Gymnopus androsaceus JB14 TaxID=1447944 RepID=A0A6A4GC38_9AGAR|nr:hypothetical protein BT96DRAFT_1009674 [Gymnopus androsaceus JB14]
MFPISHTAHSDSSERVRSVLQKPHSHLLLRASLTSLLNGLSPYRLQSFARTSIESPNPPGPCSSHATTGAAPSTPSWSYAALDERRRSTVPQNLYFYSLACSPTDEENRTRKARLRYYQPSQPSTSAPDSQRRPSFPANIQSVSTSPDNVVITVLPPTLLDMLLHTKHRQREVLIGLAVAETTLLLQYTSCGNDPYTRQSAADSAASTASKIFLWSREHDDSELYQGRGRSYGSYDGGSSYADSYTYDADTMHSRRCPPLATYQQCTACRGSFGMRTVESSTTGF